MCSKYMIQGENVKITNNEGPEEDTENDFALAGRRDRRHIKNLKKNLGNTSLSYYY